MEFKKTDNPNLHFYKSASVLVTGASGFIGKQLCSDFLELGAVVHGITRQPADSPELDARVTWHTLHLEESADTKKVVDLVKPMYVFHLAGVPNASRDEKMILPTFAGNLVSTVNLMTACIPHQCRRVVLAGSLEEPADEDNQAWPSSPYAASKMAQATYANLFSSVYNVQLNIARIFMVYGPGQADMKKLVPYVIESVLRGNKPSLSAGMRLVDWIHVADVSQCLIHMAVSNEAAGKRIDVGTGELTLVRDVASTLARLINPDIQPEFGAVQSRSDEQIRKANPQRTFDLIAYRPRMNLEQGLLHTIDWYKSALKL